MNKQELLNRLAASRAELLAEIETLDEAAMTGPAVEGVWTVKDILGHIASWEEACLIPLHGYAASGTYDSQAIPDHLAWNDVQSAKKDSLPLEQVRREMLDVRQELTSQLVSLPEDLWDQPVSIPWGETGSMEALVSGLIWHEGHHLKSIREGIRHVRLPG